MSEDVQRDLGKHEAKIETMDDRIARLETKVDTLIAAVEQAKGGWKILMGVSAASSALTAVVFKFWGIMKGGL